MTVQPSSIGLKSVSSVQLYVRHFDRWRDYYLRNLDFSEVAVSTPEFEREHQARACAVEAGLARFVILAPTAAEGEAFRWLQKHPEGVGCVAFEVEDVERTFALLSERGGTPTGGIQRREGEQGTIRWFDVVTPIGDTLFRFEQRSGRGPVLPGLVTPDRPAAPGRNRFGVQCIDHLTLNFLTLQPALMWMKHVMGLDRYWDIAFHTEDAAPNGAAGGSGLRSVVMWDPSSGVKFANNEPAAPRFHASQIYQFCEDHRGAGVQHVALAVSDIVAAVRGMRQAGVRFMPSPGTYYDMLPQRLVDVGVDRIDEDVDLLRTLEILVDGNSARRYLLQVFTREAATLFDDPQAGPLFLEIIQRKGDAGFGAGNFQALFESIERQQQIDHRPAEIAAERPAP